jgi:hypothetical protein
MATTAFVVEILVAGLLAMVWLLMVPVTLLFPSEARALAEELKNFSGYSLLLGFIVLAVAYTLGWLINSVTYWIAYLSYRRTLQRQIIGRQCTREIYENLRTAVLMNKECEEVVNKLSAQTAVHRITRAGGLNFLALGIMTILLGGSSALTAVGSGVVILGLSFWWVAIDWHREYMSLMRTAAAAIPTTKEALDKAGERSISFPDRFLGQVKCWWRVLAPNTSAAPDANRAARGRHR